jgi:hypothetical protein
MSVPYTEDVTSKTYICTAAMIVLLMEDICKECDGGAHSDVIFKLRLMTIHEFV